MTSILRPATCLLLVCGLGACAGGPSPDATGNAAGSTTGSAAPHRHDFGGATTGSLFGDDTETGNHVEHAGAIGAGGPGSHTTLGPH